MVKVRAIVLVMARVIVCMAAGHFYRWLWLRLGQLCRLWLGQLCVWAAGYFNSWLGLRLGQLCWLWLGQLCVWAAGYFNSWLGLRLGQLCWLWLGQLCVWAAGYFNSWCPLTWYYGITISEGWESQIRKNISMEETGWLLLWLAWWPRCELYIFSVNHLCLSVCLCWHVVLVVWEQFLLIEGEMCLLCSWKAETGLGLVVALSVLISSSHPLAVVDTLCQ